ncbi:MAG TPA: Sua5/YciO/YrdC/YwlC family protein, partial [Phytomonospora sp.]
ADPTGRRYRAEPVGCPKCGPRLTWTARESSVDSTAPALDDAIAALAAEGLVAVKSVGGYRLFADAASAGALARLRDFDPRPPALLMPGADAAEALIGITRHERRLLLGTDAPITLVSTVHSALGRRIAPGVGEVGVQLPHTPLLHLLATALDRPLAFTAGPRLITDDHEAVRVLGLVADGILAHDQHVAAPVDDAVLRADPDGTPRLQRAGRGHRTPLNGKRRNGSEPVQRHHAQVVATAAEHDVPGPFLGVAYDALGPGGDGTYWGGEVLLAGYTDFMRVGRFAHAPLPGGEAALDHPARLALGYLFGLESLGGQGIEPELTAPLLARFEPSLVTEVRHTVDGASRASSAGMLYEAMAAVLGVHDVNTYRGEGSRLLAGTVGPGDDDAPALPWRLARRDGLWVYDPAPTLAGALTALAEKVPVGRIASAFESTLVEVTLAMIAEVARRTMIQAVCLGGSVFGHRRLALRMLDALTGQGFGAFLNSATAPGQDTADYGRDAVADARDRRDRR